MPFTEFCCRSGGSNLNAGTRTGNSTEPGTSADFTYASGNWVAATGVFTVASGNPQTDGVAVGDYASVYADGSTVTGFVGRVTARDATTITVSLTAKAGTAPTDGTGNRTLKIGGAWQGPNGAQAFPIGFVDYTLKNSSNDPVRVNFKDAATYSVSAAMTQSAAIDASGAGIVFQGYTSSYDDGGKATIDGGTSGVSYVVLNTSASGVHIVDIIFQNNGATSSATGVQASVALGVVVHGVRGIGLQVTRFAIECEAYDCNQSNDANLAGIRLQAGATAWCSVSHDNTASNASGFDVAATGNFTFSRCISAGNGRYGFRVETNSAFVACTNCDAYDNGSHGIYLAESTSTEGSHYIVNCNLLKNGGYGIQIGSSSTVPHSGFIINCAFGSGTQANTSGQINAASRGLLQEAIDSITYAADVTPWADPDNGDFRITLAAAKGAGRGAFTQTAAGYSGTVGYPDIGAAQHLSPVPGPAARSAILSGAPYVL